MSQLCYNRLMPKKVKQKEAGASERVGLDEAKELLKIDRATIYRRINKGLITPIPKAPGALIRHRLEFDRAELNRYLESLKSE